jgi:hypothetical protein
MAGSQTTTLMEQVIFQADDISVDHIEPLVSTLNATDVQVLEGNNITWTAVIDGHSAAKFIVWYDKEGQPIFNSSRSQIRAQVAEQQTISCLTVIRVNRSDQGVYRFTASIKDRVQCLNFTLRVVGESSFFFYKRLTRSKWTFSIEQASRWCECWQAIQPSTGGSHLSSIGKWILIHRRKFIFPLKESPPVRRVFARLINRLLPLNDWYYSVEKYGRFWTGI